MFLHTPTKPAQVDFRKEARHIQEFSSYLDTSGMRSVATCPFVYKALSTQRWALNFLGRACLQRFERWGRCQCLHHRAAVQGCCLEQCAMSLLTWHPVCLLGLG